MPHSFQQGEPATTFYWTILHSGQMLSGTHVSEISMPEEVLRGKWQPRVAQILKAAEEPEVQPPKLPGSHEESALRNRGGDRFPLGRILRLGRDRVPASWAFTTPALFATSMGGSPPAPTME